jgi:UDP-N-acetylglucosamine--dolichyl-phosphate N-acetylglucosaminephosphotransferase
MFNLILFGFTISIISSVIFTILIAKIMKKINKVGIDIHKVEKPEVPESVGLSISMSIILGLLIPIIYFTYYSSNQELISILLIMLSIILIVTFVGIYDDFKTLSALAKPGILLLASLPIFFFRVAQPFPALPFVGELRLTILYWFVAVFVVTIVANSANMIDVLNGSMSGSFIIVAITAFIASFIIPLNENSEFIARYGSMVLLGSLLGFWWFNKYPAKVFAGDTGSLVTGAFLGLIAIYGELEFVLIVALLVHIMNSFSIIGSVGGLIERRDMIARPVQVKDGLISASSDLKAPITLVRLLVARKAKTEKEIVNNIYALVSYCCILAILSAYMIRVALL